MKEGNSGEEAYRDLFENARDVIVILDLKGNVAAVNRAAEENTASVGRSCSGRICSTSSPSATGHGCSRSSLG
jgi:hypothetical protein